jgi:putative tricarboxylic transport membrane protein
LSQSNVNEPSCAKGVPQNVVELLLAGVLCVVAAIVIADSLRLGAGWADDGPQSGYFPFYSGVALLFAALVIAVQTLMRWRTDQTRFASATQLASVARMFVPIVLFVAALSFLGVYVAAALYIGLFMRWQGQFSWWRCALVGVAVPCLLFALFELWFHVPLPKGPLEQMFGL